MTIGVVNKMDAKGGMGLNARNKRCSTHQPLSSTPFHPSSLSRCCYVLDANGEARSFRPRDRDEMVKQVRLDDTKLQYA